MFKKFWIFVFIFVFIDWLSMTDCCICDLATIMPWFVIHILLYLTSWLTLIQFECNLCVAGSATPARAAGRLQDNLSDLFSFSDKKDLSAFLKFVEDGVMEEKTLQRVGGLFYLLRFHTAQEFDERLVHAVLCLFAYLLCSYVLINQFHSQLFYEFACLMYFSDVLAVGLQ